MKTQRSNIKLLTYTSHDERKMIMEYWIKERDRLIWRGSRILSNMFADINCDHGIYLSDIGTMDSIRIEMNEVRNTIFKLEHQEKQYQEGINYENFLL